MSLDDAQQLDELVRQLHDELPHVTRADLDAAALAVGLDRKLRDARESAAEEIKALEDELEREEDNSYRVSEAAQDALDEAVGALTKAIEVLTHARRNV